MLVCDSYEAPAAVCLCAPLLWLLSVPIRDWRISTASHRSGAASLRPHRFELDFPRRGGMTVCCAGR